MYVETLSGLARTGLHSVRHTMLETRSSVHTRATQTMSNHVLFVSTLCNDAVSRQVNSEAMMAAASYQSNELKKKSSTKEVGRFCFV